MSKQLPDGWCFKCNNPYHLCFERSNNMTKRISKYFGYGKELTVELDNKTINNETDQAIAVDLAAAELDELRLSIESKLDVSKIRDRLL